MVFDSYEAARGNTECWGVRRQVLASCVDSPWHSDDAAASTFLGGCGMLAARMWGWVVNLIVKFNSPGFVFLGGVLILGGLLVGISMWTPWSLLAILPGLQCMFRPVRDSARSRFDEFSKLDGMRLQKSWQEIYGVVGRRFVVGPIEDATIDIIERLREANRPGQTAEFDDCAAANPVQVGPVQIWQLDAIEKIEVTSGEKVCVVSSGGGTAELRLSDASVLEKSLELLQESGGWEVRTKGRRKFEFNGGAWLLCLPLVFFGLATVLASAGLIGINQVPLLRLADVRQRPMRGKAGGVAWMYAALCEGYVFVVEQLPAAVGCLLGIAVAVGVLRLVVALQWKSVTDSVWSPVRFVAEGGSEF